MVSAEHRQRKRYDCAECGMTEDADVNAARNILHKALGGQTNAGLPASRRELDSQNLHSLELLTETAE